MATEVSIVIKQEAVDSDYILGEYLSSLRCRQAAACCAPLLNATVFCVLLE